MERKNQYYVVRDKALPEVLQKVVEVKALIEANGSMTIQEAAEKVGISRSSFYKYKDEIYPISDNTRGKTVTLVISGGSSPDRRGLPRQYFDDPSGDPGQRLRDCYPKR